MYIKFDDETYCCRYLAGYFILTNNHKEIRLAEEIYHALKAEGGIKTGVI